MINLAVVEFRRRGRRGYLSPIFLLFPAVYTLISGWGPAFGQSQQPSAVGSLKYSYTAHYKDSEIEIAVAPADGEDPTSSTGLTDFLVVKKTEAPTQRVHIPNDFGMVTSIERVSASKFIILQSSPAPYTGIEIFDTRQMKFVESFPCYTPALSPNHRFLAFIRMYPAHFVTNDMATSNYVMIYDFAKSPEKNDDRHKSPAGRTETENGHLIYPTSYDLTAFPLNGRRYSEHVGVSGPLTFSRTSDKLLFLVTKYRSLTSEPTKGLVDATSSSVPESASLTYVLVDLTKSTPATSVVSSPDCVEPSGDDCGTMMIQADVDDSSIHARLRISGLPDKVQTLSVADFKKIN